MAYEEYYGGDPRLAALMRKRKLAEALMAEGSSTAPAASPFVGLSRVAQALAGAWQGSMIDDEAKKIGEAGDADLARLKAQALGVDLGGSRAGVADQLIAGSVPTPDPQMVAPQQPVSQSPLPPEELMPLFQQASAETGIPVPILVAQAQTESGFNPNAVSPTGARGVMQVLPSTAADPGYGVQPVDPSKLSDPSVNIPFAARYLAGRGKEVGVTDWNDPTQAAKALRAYAGADTPQGDKAYDRKVLGLVPQQGGATMAFSGQPAPQQAGLPSPAPQQAPPWQGMMSEADRLYRSGVEAVNSRDPRARKLGEVMIQKSNALQSQAQAMMSRADMQAFQQQSRDFARSDAERVRTEQWAREDAIRAAARAREDAQMQAELARKPDPIKQAQFQQADVLRDEFGKLTTDFRTVQGAYENIRSAASSKSGPGDMSMLYSYVKLLDPTSVVRESEFATAAASGSFGERVQGMAKRILSGERLPDTVRDGFLTEAKSIYRNQRKGHDQMASQYEKLAKRFGIDPDTVVTRFDREQDQIEIPKAAADALREGVETEFGNGQVWTLQNGKPVKVR